MGQVSNDSADTELVRLFERIAERQGRTLAFEEVRGSELLTEPVVVSGTLRRAEDGRLIREIQRPRRETHTLYEDRVEITRPNGYSRSVNLKKAPELQALRYALSAILTGRIEQLREQFELIWSQQDSAWQIRMSPLDKDIAKALEALVLRGCSDRIEAIELQLSDSEMIRMNIRAPAME
ncbi:MAG: LolA-related protein [Wenzhouxiangellaceae bacterium]|nr:LolA-related protein [Wenzhouxiangellaceae bacterium]